MWFYPWLSYLVIFCILSILIVMLILPEHRMEVIATGALTLSIVCMSAIFNARKSTVRNAELA
jgi:GABA permease